jgi:hypothetical protein
MLLPGVIAVVAAAVGKNGYVQCSLNNNGDQTVPFIVFVQICSPAGNRKSDVHKFLFSGKFTNCSIN